MLKVETAQRRPSQDIPHGFHGLWSLWDIMHRFRAASFGGAMLALGRAAMVIQAARAANIEEDVESEREIIAEAITQAAPWFQEASLSVVARYQFEQLEKRCPVANGEELSILTRELCNGVMLDLTSAWFLMIPADHREKYVQANPPFGAEVSTAFPNAAADIAAASRCYALDEWTASVFHLMRALEHGLRHFADVVGLGTDAMAHENWKNVIDQIEKKIREMEQEKKSPEKIERLKVLSAAAVQFRYFKDAWRNHVAHAHVHYDSHSGPKIWEHVRSFMQSLAIPVSAAS